MKIYVLLSLILNAPHSLGKQGWLGHWAISHRIHLKSFNRRSIQNSLLDVPLTYLPTRGQKCSANHCRETHLRPTKRPRATKAVVLQKTRRSKALSGPKTLT